MTYVYRGVAIFIAILMLVQPAFALAAPSEAMRSKVATSTPVTDQVLTKAVQGAPNKAVAKTLTDYVPGEIIVKFKENRVDLKKAGGVSKSTQFAVRHDLSLKENIRRANLTVLKTRGKETAEQAIARLKADPDVEYVQPNYQYYPLTSGGGGSSIGTNDPSRDELWGLHNSGQNVDGTSGTSDADIDAVDAWNISTGSNTIVAVIDSGVAYNHPDLEANMWDGSNCVVDGSTPGNCNHGYDFEDEDKTPLPTGSSHGTHIAGIIAAAKNNAVGIIGVAPDAKIMALKSSLTTADNIAAITFAKNNGASVINASWGCAVLPDQGGSGADCEGNGDYGDQALQDAIAAFPGLFVTAAGNGNDDNDAEGDNHDSEQTLHSYPCDLDLPNIICAAATDQDDLIAEFSDFGLVSVDMGAPGVNILSSVADSTAFVNDFESVTAPNLPSGWTKTGNWGTYDFGDNTVLYGDLATPYANNANTTATAPTVNLSGASGATLSFYTVCDTEYTTSDWFDYMQLEYSADGTNFTGDFKWDEASLDMLNDDSDPSGLASFYFENVPIPSQYLSSNFKLRFRWVTDELISNFDGCSIDDIEISKFSDGSDNLYSYKNGTSFAAPHVAGAVAQVFALRPDFNIAQVKAAILENGDAKASLVGKTVSGKRLNASAALSAANTGTLIVKKVVMNDDAGGATATDFSFQVNGGTATAFEADGQNDFTVATGTYTVTEVPVDGYTTSYESCENIALAAGGTATCTITNDDAEPADSTTPIITLNGSAAITLTVGDTFTDPGATASDDVDGDISADIVVGGDTVDTNTVGTYVITYNVSDAAGNTAIEVTRTVVVEEEAPPEPEPDTTPPVITLSGSATMTLTVGDTFTDPGASATDDVDGSVAVFTSGTVDTNTAGTYTLTYTAEDSSDNEATATRTVIVEEEAPPQPEPDTTAPVISLVGDNPQVIIVGEEYTEPGATASDNIDGDITGSIAADSSAVNTTTVGEYEVTYNVSDAAGNAATQVVRTVSVVETEPEPTPDTTAPVISLVGANPQVLTVGDAYTELGATASDNIDGDITSSIVTDASAVDTTTVGEYEVTYNVSDAAGNAAVEVSRTVSVEAEPEPTPDTAPPIITLIGGSTLNVSTGSTFTDPGATASDHVDGDLTSAIVVTGTVDMATVGEYTLTYSVSDAAGNGTSTARTVNVSDLALSTEQQSTVASNSTMIIWTTSHAATSRVLWDTVSHTTESSIAAGPSNYSYANTTTEDSALVTNHSVTISGLSPSTTYFFRPVSHGSPEMLGNEVSVTTSATPASPAPSGGGGGGGGGSTTKNTYSASINNGAATTASTAVTLTISRTGNANQMQVSNTSNFSNVEWIAYKNTHPWTLTSGSGTKTVYVRFGNNGTVLGTARDSITLVERVVPAAQTATSTALQTPQGQVLGASTYNFAQPLQLGSTGPDVTELQKILIAAGYLKIDTPTGYFGPITVAAVKAYQSAHGLEPVGIVGPKTRALLNKGTTSSGSGDNATLIAQLQAQVKELQAKIAELLAKQGTL